MMIEELEKGLCKEFFEKVDEMTKLSFADVHYLSAISSVLIMLWHPATKEKVIEHYNKVINHSGSYLKENYEKYINPNNM